MFKARTRRAALAAALLAIGGSIAGQAQAAVKCFFKDCIVYPDGTRMCVVKEVPCPSET